MLLLAVAALAPLLACAVLAALRDDIANTNAALVLVLLVVAVAASGRRWAGVVAAVSSGVWFGFFLTEPYDRFAIDDRADVETTVLLVLIGLGVSEIALWGRRQQARASARRGYLDGIVAAAGLAAGTQEAPAAVALVTAQVRDVLEIDDCRFTADAAEPSRPRLGHDGSVTRGGAAVDVRRAGLPTDDEIELEVQHGGRAMGRLLLVAATRVRRPTLEQRLVAVALADQIGALQARADGPQR